MVQKGRGPRQSPTVFRGTANALLAIRPDQLSDPQLADPTIDRWFDVGAFGAPPIGRFGTAARGAIESSGLNLCASD